MGKTELNIKNVREYILYWIAISPAFAYAAQFGVRIDAVPHVKVAHVHNIAE